MLPVELDSGWRWLVVGGRLRLLQVAWSSWATSALPAGQPAVLGVAVSVPTANSSADSDADSAARMLVLHQWSNCPDNAGGMSRARRSMLSHARRSGPALQRSLLVLHQRSHRSGQRRGMQRTGRSVLFIQRRSAPALRTIMLVLHQRPGRPSSSD